MRAKILMIMFLAVLVLLPGCEADGERLLSLFERMMDRPVLFTGLATFALAIITPLVAQIPVVGIPFSIAIAKFGAIMIPAIAHASKTFDQEWADQKRPGEVSAAIVGNLGIDPGSKVGRVPGAGMVAGVLAKEVVKSDRRARRRAARREARASKRLRRDK